MPFYLKLHLYFRLWRIVSRQAPFYYLNLNPILVIADIVMIADIIKRILSWFSYISVQIKLTDYSPLQTWNIITLIISITPC